LLHMTLNHLTVDCVLNRQLSVVGVCSDLDRCAFFLFTDPATTDFYTLSLHDALPIFELFIVDEPGVHTFQCDGLVGDDAWNGARSEEHTSELQSRFDLVCRLLLEKKKKKRCCLC